MAKALQKKMPNGSGPVGLNPEFPVDFSKLFKATNKGSADPFSYPGASKSSENINQTRGNLFHPGPFPLPSHPGLDNSGSTDFFSSSAGRNFALHQGLNSSVPSTDHPDQDTMVWNTGAKLMDKQFQEKIRPCIDLIDSLRSFGVEKDLALPAIAVIGDQSSGKSSVLEALSGVTLPRGNGIVTRCPLELKLKKSAHNSPWCGTLSYKNRKVSLQGPSAVENEVRKAQDSVAGPGKGISNELITLEVISPNVPDLTLIDLPGITRIALPDQPQDIGNQIKQIIKKYITKQETINLAVVPSNVDIATTEVLEMAREVDPTGERTIGVLTKPDLVDGGAEREVLRVAQNRVYSLKKGYMMVKCRGQREIQNNISLEEAIINEKTFFENHEHFRVLLKYGQAAIPNLAERLTKELVYHISKTLPIIDQQIRSKLRDAEEQLTRIGRGVPETEDEKTAFIIEKIRDFDDRILKLVDGNEEGNSEDLKLFKNLRKLFSSWEIEIKNSCAEFVNELKKEKDLYENQYRGRELNGFINYKKFENIMKKHLARFEDPAVCLLHKVTELIQKCFTDVASNCFAQFENLYNAATDKIEDISHKQKKEAEGVINLQFKMEKIIYCQDSQHSEVLSAIRFADTCNGLPVEKQLPLNELACHMEAYFQNTTNRLANQVPMIIQHHILNEFKEQLLNQMIRLLDGRNKNDLLEEKDGLSGERQRLRDKIQRLELARERLQKFCY
ncbi:interferon-induced GTP-binding protein Mx2-like isoform X2 [Dendropsophus ebraccatus]|uniref:interferon-induced GTP-binding protein Mx2-like isoform X2 n=1 Tax=Dendropsophus ebraccatus TaxID=150705 RepID=UPI0038317AC9